jgi:hypothetical protein
VPPLPNEKRPEVERYGHGFDDLHDGNPTSRVTYW